MKETTVKETIHLMGNKRINKSTGSLISNGKDMLVGITKTKSLQKRDSSKMNGVRKANEQGPPTHKDISSDAHSLFIYLGVDHVQ